MKQIVLAMMAAAMMCTLNVHAQNKVTYLNTNANSVNVKQLENTDQTVQVNRYFFAGYNTLCLPMSLDAKQLAQAARNVKIERLAAIGQEGNTLCLYFVDCTNEGIEAGVPYLVFSPTAQTLRARNTNAQGIDTELKTIRMNDGQGNQVAFNSSWDLRLKDGLYGIPAKQNVAVLESVLISTNGQGFLPTRCGFSWEQQSSTATTLEIRHATAADVTAIQSLTIDNEQQGAETYDLNGRRINNASKRGLVIQNGKKVVK